MAEIIPDPEIDSEAPDGTKPVFLTDHRGQKYIVYANEGEDQVNMDLDPFDSFESLERETTNHQVNWRPEDRWRDTDDATRATVPLRRYMFGEDVTFWDFRLTFSTDARGLYGFLSASGELHVKAVVDTSSDHVIDFDRRGNPTIVKVYWSSIN